MSDILPIATAIENAGSQRALAERLGCTPGLVSQWLTGRLPVAAHWCRKIEDATHGAVTRYALREDIFGPGGTDDDACTPVFPSTPPSHDEGGAVVVLVKETCDVA